MKKYGKKVKSKETHNFISCGLLREAMQRAIGKFCGLTIKLQTTAGSFAKISKMRGGNSLLNSNGAQGLVLKAL